MIQLTDKSQCCGCTACASICPKDAIHFESDLEGFNYPNINLHRCINCGLCEKVCPIINYEKRHESYKAIFAFRTKDNNVLMRSSSGGAFFSIASIVINEFKGVVFGVEYDKNMIVRHSYAENLKDLKSFQGSKYVQSDMSGIFENVKSFLRKGRFVLFTGTPCQVMALKLFLRKDYENLLTVDIICHSVPSPQIFKEYINYVESIYHAKLYRINMRSKIKGWSHQFYYYYYFTDGRKIGSDKLKCEHWGKLFFSGLITRPCCNHCKFTSYRRSGDITIADYWDDEGKRKDAYSPKGTSLFIVSSEKGMTFKRKLESTSLFWELNENEAYQPCLEKPCKINPNRDLFWQYYKSKGFVSAYNKFFKVTIQTRIKRKIKTYLKKLLTK